MQPCLLTKSHFPSLGSNQTTRKFPYFTAPGPLLARNLIRNIPIRLFLKVMFCASVAITELYLLVSKLHTIYTYFTGMLQD